MAATPAARSADSRPIGSVHGEQFERIVDNLLDVALEVDAHGRLNYVGPAVREVLGYEPARLIGRHYLEYVHPDDANTFQMSEAPSLPGPSRPREVRVLSASGDYVLLEVLGRRLRDEHGRVTGAIMVSRDITARRRTEEALRTSERRYRDLVDQSSDLILSLDCGGIITAANRLACAKLAQPEESLIGRHYRDLAIPPEAGDLVNRLSRRVLKEKQTAEGEYRHAGDAGAVVFRVTLYPIRNATDTITGIGVIARDITGLVKATEDIRYLTFHDKLTGLYNRAYFEEELSRNDSERSLPLAIIIGDINGLKLANDALGHAEGDRLLANTAQAIRNVLRREDLVCRWGGDEFAVILPRTRAPIAARIRDRIAAALRTAVADPIPLSIALGMSVRTDIQQSLESVLREAENRMYRNKLLESRSIQNRMVGFLQESLWARGHETQEHALRLQWYALALGRQLGLPAEQMSDLATLAVLHDVGKVAVPHEVLVHPGPLSATAWDSVKRHSETGYRIATGSNELAAIAPAILAHHEHWDGSGYPQGLRGESIPLLARVIAIADAYEVMLAGRPHRQQLTVEDALAEIERCAGTQFDADLVARFAELSRTGLLAAPPSKDLRAAATPWTGSPGERCRGAAHDALKCESPGDAVTAHTRAVSSI